MSSAFGAGYGADMLQEILRQHAAETLAQQHLQLQQQEFQQNNQLHQAQLASVNAERQAQEELRKQQSAKMISGILRPGSTFSPNDQAVQSLQAGGMGDLFQPQQTLSSANIQGPAGGSLTATANPGQATGQLRYIGTPQQVRDQDAEDALTSFTQQNPQIAGALRLIADPDKRAAAVADFVKGQLTQPKAEKQYEVTVPGPNGQPIRKLVSAADLAGGVQEYKAPPQPQLQLITHPDAQGNEVQEFVPKKPGQTFGKGPGATTENRLQSAKAVIQTGNDIAQTLKDPAMAAQLGQVMSRFNNVADFVGAAPPEWSKLAGQIESYSLANMGVHGMRSASGADAIKQTLGQGRHTPESMLKALEGLNGFANHLLENNGQSAAPATSYQSNKETPEQRLVRLLKGG